LLLRLEQFRNDLRVGVDKLAITQQHRLHAASAAKVLGVERQFRQAFGLQRTQRGAAPRGINLLGRERRDRRVEIQIDHLQILLAQALTGQRRIERQLRCRSAKDRHAFALEILQGLDSRAGHHAEVLLHATRRGAEQARVQTIGFADDRGQIAKIGQIDLPIGKRLIDHRPGALEETPLDLDAVLGEGLFEDLLIAQHIDDAAAAVLSTGAEVGHGDADFLEFFGLGAKRKKARKRRGGQQADDSFEGKVHGCGSLIAEEPKVGWMHTFT